MHPLGRIIASYPYFNVARGYSRGMGCFRSAKVAFFVSFAKSKTTLIFRTITYFPHDADSTTSHLIEKPLRGPTTLKMTVSTIGVPEISARQRMNLLSVGTERADTESRIAAEISKLLSWPGKTVGPTGVW
jgi:hypothetical protein